MTLRGYLPPEGPQTVHHIDHTYREHQEAHVIGNTLASGTESVILTADEDAQKRIERYDIERIPDDVAKEALEAYLEDDTETIESILAAWRDGEEIGEAVVSSQPDDDSTETKSSIPLDDELEAMDYRELQTLAGEFDLPGKQSKEEFVVSLAEIRDESNE